MLNIASIQPTSWPAASSPSVAPVAAVTAVNPTHRSGEEGRPGYGSGSEGRPKASQDGDGKRSAARESGTTQTHGAPLLPRKSAEVDGSGQSRSAGATGEKERAREAEMAEQARAEQKQKLLEVLSTVWKASAAVVDVALGRESKVGSAAEAGGPTQGAAQSQPTGLKGSQQPADGLLPKEDLGKPEGAPVVYTEQGEGEWVPQGPGKFIDQTV